MELLGNMPPDPTLLGILDNAYKEAMAGYNQNIRAMKQFDEALDEAPAGEVKIMAADGQERDYYAPSYMRDVRTDIVQSWKNARKVIAQAQTAQDQVQALYSLCRESLAISSYSGNTGLVPAFFDAMINLSAGQYEDDTIEEERAEAAVMGNIERIAPSLRAFMQESFEGLCEYTEMCLSSQTDVKDLTAYYERTHGNGDNPAQTPYDVMYRRYCAAHKHDPETFSQIPRNEMHDFILKQMKFYTNELYAPFNDVFPPHAMSFEMAWFVGAAICAVRLEEAGSEMYQSESIRNILNRHIKPASFVERLFEPKAAARSSFEILSDPISMGRVKEMIGDVIDTYPNLCSDVNELVAAKAYFMSQYLDDEPEQEASMGR